MLEIPILLHLHVYRLLKCKAGWGFFGMVFFLCLFVFLYFLWEDFCLFGVFSFFNICKLLLPHQKKVRVFNL